MPPPKRMMLRFALDKNLESNLNCTQTNNEGKIWKDKITTVCPLL